VLCSHACRLSLGSSAVEQGGMELLSSHRSFAGECLVMQHCQLSLPA